MTPLLITAIEAVRAGGIRCLPPHKASENPGKPHRPEDLDSSHFSLYYVLLGVEEVAGSSPAGSTGEREGRLTSAGEKGD